MQLALMQAVSFLQRQRLCITPAGQATVGNRFKWKHAACKLMLAVQCAHLVKGGADGLREVCANAFEILFPGFGQLPASALDAMPSATQVRYHTFTLDLAMLLLEQDLASEEAEQEDAYVRFGSHDSSPLWGYDWLWSQTYILKGGDELLSFFADAHRAWIMTTFTSTSTCSLCSRACRCSSSILAMARRAILIRHVPCIFWAHTQ